MLSATFEVMVNQEFFVSLVNCIESYGKKRGSQGKLLFAGSVLPPHHFNFLILDLGLDVG